MPSTPKRLQRTPNRALSAEDFKRYAEEYLKTKAMVDHATAQLNQQKAVISKFIDEQGYEDDKGSLFVDVEGIDGVASFKRERRVSVNLDRSKAEAWLREHNLWKDYSETVEVLDEDKLVGAAYEKKIPKRTLDSFYVTSESFALKTVK